MRWKPLAILLMAVFIDPLRGQEGPRPAEAVVLRINCEPVYRVDLEREVFLLARRMIDEGQEISEDRDEQLFKDATQNLVERMLLYQESRRKGYRADPALVEKQTREFIEQFPDEQTFREFLNTFLHTPESLRKDMEQGILIQLFIDQEITGGIRISEQECRAYYQENPRQFVQPEQIHVRHILVEYDLGMGDTGRAAALREIREINGRLARGEDFAGLARRHSDDRGSASRGGDLGFVQRGQMVAAFEAAAFGLQPGQISGIVETDYGYHLIQLIEKKAERTEPYPRVRAAIEEHLLQIRVNQEVGNCLQRLKAEARIEKPASE